jgi:glutathione S-transferase
MKLIYFNIPGKAEAIRLCATVGNVEMEDVRLTGDEFAAMKSTMPYGQVPALDLGDGKVRELRRGTTTLRLHTHLIASSGGVWA